MKFLRTAMATIVALGAMILAPLPGCSPRRVICDPVPPPPTGKENPPALVNSNSHAVHNGPVVRPPEPVVCDPVPPPPPKK